MIIRLGVVLVLLSTYSAENTVPKTHGHRRYQQKSIIDEMGAYNFGYDTGTGDAHSMRMEYRDDNGIVRGRYGYTDPRGKLRMVEYEAGPHGFHAKGDIGPDEELHHETPVKVPPHLSPIRAAGWTTHLNSKNEHKTGRTVMVGGTIDHPVKGYQQERIIHRKETPIIVENVEHAVKSNPHNIMSHKTLKTTHHIKEIQPIISEPVVVDKSGNYHVEGKSVHKSPSHVAIGRISEDHPEKGYHFKRPVMLQDHISKHQPIRSHHIETLKNPVSIIEHREHHPKHIVTSKTAPVIIANKVQPHVIKEYKHPLPVPVKEHTILERHPEKGHTFPRTASVKSEVLGHGKHSSKIVDYQGTHVVAPVVVERIEQVPIKSLHTPKSINKEIRHVAKVEHHPKKVPHMPVPIKEPIIVERLEDHLAKGYQPIKSVHSKTGHHTEKHNHHPNPHLPIKAPPLERHVATPIIKHVKSMNPVAHEPVFQKTIEHHPKVVNKNKYTGHRPVVVRRLEHHTDLPAEHRDVDIVLDPAVTYNGKGKTKTALQPLTVHNMDVDPNDIRTSAVTHRHHSDNHNHHHNHPGHSVTRISSSSSIHRHSAEDYHANHSPRTHLESTQHRAYENYHANHPPRVPHRHSTTHSHGNHTHRHSAIDDIPPIVVTSVSVSSDEMVMHGGSEPRVLARSARDHGDHSHVSDPRPIRYRPWSIYSPGSFYWR